MPYQPIGDFGDLLLTRQTFSASVITSGTITDQEVIVGGGVGKIRSQNYDPVNNLGWLLAGDGTSIFNEVIITGNIIFGLDSPAELDNHVITVTKPFTRVETEGGVGFDVLQTINGGVDGQIIVLQAYHDAHTVEVEDATGNILLAQGNFIMSSDEMNLFLIFQGSTWTEISRSIPVSQREGDLIYSVVGTGVDVASVSDVQVAQISIGGLSAEGSQWVAQCWLRIFNQSGGSRTYNVSVQIENVTKTLDFTVLNGDVGIMQLDWMLGIMSTSVSHFQARAIYHDDATGSFSPATVTETVRATDNSDNVDASMQIRVLVRSSNATGTQTAFNNGFSVRYLD